MKVAKDVFKRVTRQSVFLHALCMVARESFDRPWDIAIVIAVTIVVTAWSVFIDAKCGWQLTLGAFHLQIFVSTLSYCSVARLLRPTDFGEFWCAAVALSVPNLVFQSAQVFILDRELHLAERGPESCQDGETRQLSEKHT